MLVRPLLQFVNAACDPLSSFSYSVRIDALIADSLSIFHAAFSVSSFDRLTDPPTFCDCALVRANQGRGSRFARYFAWDGPMIVSTT
jgi:hypothetical protein